MSAEMAMEDFTSGMAATMQEGSRALQDVLAAADDALGRSPSQPRLLLLLERLATGSQALHDLCHFAHRSGQDMRPSASDMSRREAVPAACDG